MHPIATDKSSVVCLFVTTVSHAKTAKLIEMLFGIWTQVGLSNYVLNGIQILPREGALLRGMTSGFSRMPPFIVALTLGFPRMLLTSILIGQLQKQLSVTLNFPNENPLPAVQPLVKIL